MKCKTCKSDMIVDPTRLLLSDPPKPAYYCEACNQYKLKVNTLGMILSRQETKVINFDAVNSIDDVKAILKCLDISFPAGNRTKDIDHLLITK